jgi:hypothetical protein
MEGSLGKTGTESLLVEAGWATILRCYLMPSVATVIWIGLDC